MHPEECEPAQEHIDNDGPVDETKEKCHASEEIKSEAYHLSYVFIEERREVFF